MNNDNNDACRARARNIIDARNALKVARFSEDEAGEQAALADLAALGVDEAGDDLDGE